MNAKHVKLVRLTSAVVCWLSFGAMVVAQAGEQRLASPDGRLELKPQAVDSVGATLWASVIWTGQPDAEQKNGACVAFRKHFQLADTAKQVTLQIFADARYMLWVNGQYVQRGPARFEPQAPEYDSMDITPNLHTGDNVIVVLVTSRISNGKTRMHAPGITAQLTQSGQMICRTDATWKWSDQTRYRAVKTDWPTSTTWWTRGWKTATGRCRITMTANGRRRSRWRRIPGAR